MFVRSGDDDGDDGEDDDGEDEDWSFRLKIEDDEEGSFSIWKGSNQEAKNEPPSGFFVIVFLESLAMVGIDVVQALQRNKMTMSWLCFCSWPQTPDFYMRLYKSAARKTDEII